MNILDIVILVVILALAIWGGARGLIHGLGTIFGFSIAFMISTRYVGTVGSMFMSGIKLPPVAATVLSYILTFIIVFIAFKIVLKVIVKIMHSTPLGAIDTIGGGIVGLLLGATLLSIIFVVLSIFPFSKQWEYGQQTSKLYPSIIKVAPLIYKVYATITSRNQTLYDEFAFLEQYVTGTAQQQGASQVLQGSGSEIFQILKKMSPEEIKKQIENYNKLSEGTSDQHTPYSEALRLLKADTSSATRKSLDDVLKNIK